MTKRDLVDKVNYITGIPKKDTRECIDACLSVIEESMKNDEEVGFHGFGKFIPVIKEERFGVNPSTQERVVIPKHRAMKFMPSDRIKSEIYNV